MERSVLKILIVKAPKYSLKVKIITAIVLTILITIIVLFSNYYIKFTKLKHTEPYIARRAEYKLKNRLNKPNEVSDLEWNSSKEVLNKANSLVEQNSIESALSCYAKAASLNNPTG